jgi:hypothetical protein
MADFIGIDRTTEDKDIAREGMAATGNPTRGGSPLDILKAKFKGLDEQRTKVLPVVARNGEQFWLELDLDVTEDDMNTYTDRADRANRAQRRAGQSDISQAVLAGNVISEKNTRMWAVNPLDKDDKVLAGVAPVVDTEGDPITVHSEEWCEALGFPGDPVGGLRHLLGDFSLVALFNLYSQSVGTDVDPTRA